MTTWNLDVVYPWTTLASYIWPTVLFIVRVRSSLSPLLAGSLSVSFLRYKLESGSATLAIVAYSGDKLLLSDHCFQIPPGVSLKPLLIELVPPKFFNHTAPQLLHGTCWNVETWSPFVSALHFRMSLLVSDLLSPLDIVIFGLYTSCFWQFACCTQVTQYTTLCDSVSIFTSLTMLIQLETHSLFLCQRHVILLTSVSTI